MAERQVSRRDFLKFGAGSLALVLLGSGGAIGIQANTFSNEAEMQRNARLLLKTFPSLSPYTVFQGHLPLTKKNLEIAVIQPRKALDSTAGIRLCDGAIPSVSVVNQHGVSISYAEDMPFERPDEAKAIIGNHNITDLLVTVRGETELIVHGKKTPKILVAGDSWTKWGGIEYSFPVMLQRLFAFSGYNVRVDDVSSSGVNLANHIAILEVLKSQNVNPDLIISTLHGTDYSQDAQRVLLPVTEQTQLLGNGTYQASSDFHPSVQSLKMTLRLFESVFPAITKLREKYRGNRGGDTRVIRNEKGYIQDAGLLSPLTEYGAEIFDVYLDIVHSYLNLNPNSSHTLLVLPDGLTDDTYSAFDAQVCQPIVNTATALDPHFLAINNHDYPSMYYDAFNHPTPAGAFWLAVRAYYNLTKKVPTPEELSRTWDHYKDTHSKLEQFRTNLQSIT